MRLARRTSASASTFSDWQGPIGLVLGQRIGEIDGVDRSEPPVHLDEDVDVWTHGVALPAQRRDRREVLSSSGSGSILS
jgi:hypothetical protein